MIAQPAMLLNDLRYTARLLRKSPVFTIAVVLAACLLPARNASRVDPMVALRYD